KVPLLPRMMGGNNHHLGEAAHEEESRHARHAVVDGYCIPVADAASLENGASSLLPAASAVALDVAGGVLDASGHELVLRRFAGGTLRDGASGLRRRSRQAASARQVAVELLAGAETLASFGAAYVVGWPARTIRRAFRRGVAHQRLAAH